MQHTEPQHKNLVLLVPEKQDLERDEVARVWCTLYGQVLRVGKFWEPPDVEPATVRLYGGESFCLVLAQKLGLELVTPPDNLLTSIAPQWLQRTIIQLSLRDGFRLQFPIFLKPIIPKQFPAAVYETASDLEAVTAGLADETQILSSDIVQFQNEIRTFVLDGKVVSASMYEGTGNVQEAISFVETFAANTQLPKTVVVDVGRLSDASYAVVETNATWGSGLNGCDAAAVCKCLAHAVVLKT
jgi:hypothetical protein